MGLYYIMFYNILDTNMIKRKQQFNVNNTLIWRVHTYCNMCPYDCNYHFYWLLSHNGYNIRLRFTFRYEN